MSALSTPDRVKPRIQQTLSLATEGDTRDLSDESRTSSRKVLGAEGVKNHASAPMGATKTLTLQEASEAIAFQNITVCDEARRCQDMKICATKSACKTAQLTSPPSQAYGHEEEHDDSEWSFDLFIRELSEKEQKHEARKERTFRKVLSSLGGPENDETSMAGELPPSILRAWQTRGNDMALAKAKARSDSQKREVHA